jgi:hypothetical protein
MTGSVWLPRLSTSQGERTKVRGLAATPVYSKQSSPSPSPLQRERRPIHKLWRDVGACCRLSNVSLVPITKNFGFTLSELRQLRALKTPAGIQKFLDALPYNLSYTARSPKKVLHDRTASCLEGGIFAAAALRVLGFPPLIFDLEAEQDTDHVVAIFKVRGHWGAVAKSNFTGCRYREPVYRSLREVAMSYFNIYFNLRGERTLRRYSRPVNLARFDDLNWMTTEKPIWFIAEYLCDIPHISLLKPVMEKNLTRVDRRTMSGEMVGHRKK